MPTKPNTKLNMTGPGGQLYAEQKVTPDENAFQRNNTSAAYYNSPYYAAHKNQVQPIPQPRQNASPNIVLTDFVAKEIITAINAASATRRHISSARLTLSTCVSSVTSRCLLSGAIEKRCSHPNCPWSGRFMGNTAAETESMD